MPDALPCFQQQFSPLRSPPIPKFLPDGRLSSGVLLPVTIHRQEYFMTTTYQRQPTTNTNSIRQQITDTIISQLEAGAVPWHKPWRNGQTGVIRLPKNYTTGNKYRGINIILLWGAADDKEFSTQEWGTLKQWNAKKQSIRKGERGNMIMKYGIEEKEIEGELKEIPYVKRSIVFNRCQLKEYDAKTELGLTENPVDPIAAADAFVGNSKSIIDHHVGKAYFDPACDQIFMPLQECFIDTPTSTATEGYYATLLHELTHWTGYRTRLNRKFGAKEGDKDYATEELIAEFGAAFLCAELGIHMPEQSDHAGYIAYWLEVLKNNKNCLFTAASEASKAVDYLQGHQPQLQPTV